MPNPPDFPSRLRSEIGGWIRDGLLSDKAAQTILSRYPTVAIAQTPSSTSALTRTLGVLGALLIGLGIILIFAYNWKDLSQTAKLILAFIPLTANIALAAYTLARKSDSLPWRESVGISLGISAAACLALAGQTLQLQSDLGRFYFTWQISCLPFLFALRSRALFSLLCFITICWTVTSSSYDLELIALRFTVVSIPLFAYLFWERHTVQSVFSSIAYAVSTIWTFTWLTAELLPVWTPVLGFALITATFYLWFARTRNRGLSKRLFTAPELLCKLGLTTIAFILSFEDSWSIYHYGSHSNPTLVYVAFTIGAALYLIELTRQLRYSTWHDFPWTLIPASVALLSLASDTTAALVFTPYIVLMAIAAIHHGYTTHSIARLNHGLLIILVLAATRFFDDEFSMLVKGSAFIVVGLLFLLTNLHFIKHRKDALHESA